MTKTPEHAEALRCLNCDHPFSASELAGITVAEGTQNRFLKCASCGATNVVRSEPRPGFNHQPAAVVLRIAESDAEPADVFEESVEPGTRVHPVTAGESG